MRIRAKSSATLAALCAGLLAGCAQQPQDPAFRGGSAPVVVVPSDTKTYAEFRQDDTACRQQAGGGAQPSPQPPAAQPPEAQGSAAPAPAAAAAPERVYADCMVARGNTLAPPPQPGYSAAYPGAYPAYAYDAYLYDGPAFYGYYGFPFAYGFYGGFGGAGYFPGRFYPGHAWGYYHGGGFRGGDRGGSGGHAGGGFASARGGFSGGRGGR